MTDRVRTLTVVLDRDLRTDDAEQLVAAIKLLRGVQTVVQGEPVTPGDHLAREVAKAELRQELAELLLPKWSP